MNEIEMKREVIEISGGRKLYNYTFRNGDPQSELLRMVETGEVGVIGAFLQSHPDLDLSRARELARRLGNQEAIRELGSGGM